MNPAVMGEHEARLLALECSMRDLLGLLDEGGAELERIDAAREACDAAFGAAVQAFASEELAAGERARTVERLEAVLSLSAVARGRVEQERIALTELQGRVHGERECLRAMDRRSEIAGATCDISG